MAKKPDPPRRNRRGLRGDEAELFEAAMRHTARLSGEAPPTEDTAPEDTAAEDTAAVADPPGVAPPSPALPELAAGEGADVDSRTMARLRRGRIRPEAQLDLHGLTQGEAHRALAAFIARAQNDGRRCVIVVTGKGRVSEGGGVLRQGVPGWLNTPALRPRIMGFCAAQQRDGGAGAVYVLLRRARR